MKIYKTYNELNKEWKLILKESPSIEVTNAVLDAMKLGEDKINLVDTIPDSFFKIKRSMEKIKKQHSTIVKEKKSSKPLTLEQINQLKKLAKKHADARVL